MRKSDFWIVYLLMLLAQLLLSNYFQLTPYVMLTILPVMILSIPIRVGTVGVLLIAFVSALTVDLLSEGILGLNAFALMPVALLRNPVIRLIFGDELFARKEDFSVQRSGFGKVALAIFLVQLLFISLYVWADGASTRPLWFDLTRIGASTFASFLLSLLAAGILAPDTRR